MVLGVFTVTALALAAVYAAQTDTLSDDVTTLKTGMDGLKTDLAALTTAVNALTGGSGTGGSTTAREVARIGFVQPVAARRSLNQTVTGDMILLRDEQMLATLVGHNDPDGADAVAQVSSNGTTWVTEFADEALDVAVPWARAAQHPDSGRIVMMPGLIDDADEDYAPADYFKVCYREEEDTEWKVADSGVTFVAGSTKMFITKMMATQDGFYAIGFDEFPEDEEEEVPALRRSFVMFSQGGLVWARLDLEGDAVIESLIGVGEDVPFVVAEAQGRTLVVALKYTLPLDSSKKIRVQRLFNGELESEEKVDIPVSAGATMNPTTISYSPSLNVWLMGMDRDETPTATPTLWISNNDAVTWQRVDASADANAMSKSAALTSWRCIVWNPEARRFMGLTLNNGFLCSSEGREWFIARGVNEIVANFPLLDGGNISRTKFSQLLWLPQSRRLVCVDRDNFYVTEHPVDLGDLAPHELALDTRLAVGPGGTSRLSRSTHRVRHSPAYVEQSYRNATRYRASRV